LTIHYKQRLNSLIFPCETDLHGLGLKVLTSSECSMIYDLCKMDAYKIDPENPFGWIHKDDLLIKGHGDKSVIILSTLMQLTEEEMLCIRYHMGAFTDKEEWNYYTRAVNKYPNVLWTHHADMLASHVAGV